MAKRVRYLAPGLARWGEFVPKGAIRVVNNDRAAELIASGVAEDLTAQFGAAPPDGPPDFE